ncbi:DUF3570 domain-containing protein [Sulfurimonas sp. MAG313]|nr:DUF3570 domain-containing protein [Sulfurimonas sp. MAG313]MDF1880406.1 DUF3570 domain-containing protein [Sulfurimonas sp. MAG313]
MQMMFKYCLILLAMVSAPIKLMAETIKDQIVMSYSYYSDNVGLNTYSPFISLQKRLGEHWGMTASFEVDAVSAASIRNGNGRNIKDGVIVDAVSGASDRVGFDDLRTAPTISFMYSNGDFLMDFGSYYSTEIDYDVIAGFGSIGYGFNDANTIITLGGSYEQAQWSPSTNRKLFPSGEKSQKQFNASIMQLINPESYLQIRFSYILQEGFLASPYHYLVNDTTAQFDRYPGERTSYATAFQYVSQLGEDFSTHLEYRFYADNWDVQSHTVQAQLFYNIMDNLLFGVRARGYSQSKASFTKGLNDYRTDDKYIVSDYRLSALATTGAGLSLSYKPGFFNDDSVSFDFSYDVFSTDDNAYIENWYDETSLKANMFTFALSYDF